MICGEVEKYTKFKGQADGELNKDFTVEVDKGDKIAWQAVDISPIKRRVVVKQIRYESGDRLFKNDNFNKQWWRSRRLVERIKKNTNYGQEEKYALVFSFRKDGVKYSYIIDPKLVIRKKED